MEAIDPAVALWGLFVSAFTSATVAPGGSEAVLAYLVLERQLSPMTLLAVATLGNTLGAVSTWALGLLVALGYPVERVTRRGDHHKALARVRRWGVGALLFSWLPIIGDGLCFAAGWLKLPFFKSVIAITVGKILRYAAVVFAFS